MSRTFVCSMIHYDSIIQYSMFLILFFMYYKNNKIITQVPECLTQFKIMCCF